MPLAVRGRVRLHSRRGSLVCVSGPLHNLPLNTRALGIAKVQSRCIAAGRLKNLSGRNGHGAADQWNGQKIEAAKNQKGGLRPLSDCRCSCQAAFGGQSKFGNDFSEAWRSASE